MDTQRNIYIGFTSALLCWQIVGLKGLQPQTQTDFRTPQDAASSVAAMKQAGFLDFQFVQRLGSPIHILVPNAERRFRSKRVMCHVVSYPLPEGGLRQLCENVYVTSPEVTFAHMGTQLTELQLATVGMQLCGTYTLTPRRLDANLHMPPLATIDGLRRATAPNQRLFGSGKARKALEHCAPGSNSPRETLSFLYLTLAGSAGGYGLERPALNRRIVLSARAARIAGVSCLHPDLCWENRGLIVEYDSKEEHTESGRLIVDDVRAEAFRADGWQVITLRTNRLSDVRLFDAFVRQTLAPALRANVPPATPEFRRAQTQLRKETLHFDPYDAIQANKVLKIVG